jgi:hypothetical protein
MNSTNAIAKEIPSAVVSRLIGKGSGGGPKPPKAADGAIQGQILLAGCQDTEQALI